MRFPSPRRNGSRGSLPGEYERRGGVIPERGETGLDVLDEGRRLAGLEIGNEPLRFVSAVGGAAGPDAVAADDDEMSWGAHG